MLRLVASQGDNGGIEQTACLTEILAADGTRGGPGRLCKHRGGLFAALLWGCGVLRAKGAVVHTGGEARVRCGDLVAKGAAQTAAANADRPTQSILMQAQLCLTSQQTPPR